MGSAFTTAGVVGVFNSSAPEDMVVLGFLALSTNSAFKTLGFLLRSGLLWTLDWSGRYRGEVSGVVI